MVHEGGEGANKAGNFAIHKKVTRNVDVTFFKKKKITDKTKCLFNGNELVEYLKKKNSFYDLHLVRVCENVANSTGKYTSRALY